MTVPIFPALAGQSFPVKKTPKFATIVAPHVSGREVRDAQYLNPIWTFELVFEGLDGTTTGQYGGLGASSLQSLMGLFLQCQGAYGTFLYYDPTDYQVTAQTFGVGTGSATAFQLTRTFGAFSEAVVAPVTTTTTLNFSGGLSASAIAPIIKDNGSTVASSNYTIANGLVTFTSAPLNGHALTWTGYFGYLCRFDADDVEFEQFMSNLWRMDSLKFRSVRAQ